jgi:Protein of unknown function (DUF2723)
MQKHKLSLIATATLAAVLALAIYGYTLAPSVENGDVAELEYIPYRLGIPHPNGYPFYVLLAKAWSALPLGSLAWRMNLLSAILGAATVGMTFVLLRSTDLDPRLALAGALTWAFECTFWIWAGVAHRYTLLMLCGATLLALTYVWRRTGQGRFLVAAALAFGIGLASHISSLLFLIPSAILIAWPGRTGRLRPLWAPALCCAPLLLFFYIPWRGGQLWAGSPVDAIFGSPAVVLHGLVHPRFAPDLATLRDYLTAGNPIAFGRVLDAALSHSYDVGRLVTQEFGAVWLFMGLAGLVIAIQRVRPWGIALLALFVVDSILGLAYLQGNVEAYFLPGAWALVIGLIELLAGINRLLGRLPGRTHTRRAVFVAGLLIPIIFFVRNSSATNHRDDLVDDCLVSPWFPAGTVDTRIEFWSQHELRLPLGLAPGDYTLQAVVYHLNGPELHLQSGDPEAKLGLLRITASQPPGRALGRGLTLGPCLGPVLEHPLDFTALAGSPIELEMLWRVQCPLPMQLGLSFSLDGDAGTWTLGSPDAQQLISTSTRETGGFARTYISLKVPAEVPAGRYGLEVAAMDLERGATLARRLGPLPLRGKEQLGAVTVSVRKHSTEPPHLNHSLAASFGAGIALFGYETAEEIHVGQPVTLTLGWRATTPVMPSYTIFIHLLAPDGHIVAQRDSLPRGGALPTNVWLRGEIITDTYTLVDIEPRATGAYTLEVGLYDASTMLRVRVTSPALGAPADRLGLGAIHVLP